MKDELSPALRLPYLYLRFSHTQKDEGGGMKDEFLRSCANRFLSSRQCSSFIILLWTGEMRCKALPRCPGDSWPVPGRYFCPHSQPRDTARYFSSGWGRGRCAAKRCPGVRVTVVGARQAFLSSLPTSRQCPSFLILLWTREMRCNALRCRGCGARSPTYIQY